MNIKYTTIISLILFTYITLTSNCFAQCNCENITAKIDQSTGKTKPKKLAKGQVDKNLISLQAVPKSTGIDPLLNKYIKLIKSQTLKVGKNIKLIECLDPKVTMEGIPPCKDTSYILYSKKFIQNISPQLLEFVLAHEISHHMQGHFHESLGDKDIIHINQLRWKYEFFADAEALWLLSKIKDRWLTEKEIDLIFENLKAVMPIDSSTWSHPSFDYRNDHLQIQALRFKKTDIKSSERTYEQIGRMEFTRDSIINKRGFFLSEEEKKTRDEQLRQAENEKRTLDSLNEVERQNKKIKKDDSTAIANYKFALETVKTTVNQYLIDMLKYTKDALERNSDRKEKIRYLIEKLDLIYNKKPNYFTFEPILGIELLDGIVKKNEQKLNPQFFPLYKFGIRFSRPIWTNHKKLIFPWAVEIAGNYTKIDLYQFIEGNNRTVERIRMYFIQAIPRIGFGYRFWSSEKDNLNNSTKSDFVAFSVGLPVNLGRYDYNNFLTAQTSSIKLNTKFLHHENLAYQITYNHASRISGKVFNIKHSSSYSISFQYYGPSFTFKTTEKTQNDYDKIISKIGFYEVKLAYRCWR